MATASSASFTTRSRAATSARARRTSIGWPSCRLASSTTCVAQGVPFAREYGGLLANRSFGGALVSRTFYARGQTGPAAAARRLPGAGQGGSRGRRHGAAAARDARSGRGRRSGARRRRARPGVGRARGAPGATPWCWPPAATRTSTSCRRTPRPRNATAIWRAHRRGAAFANPVLRAVSPTCLPARGEHQAKLTLMSESLRNDGRALGAARAGRRPPGRRDPRGRARLLPRAPVSALRQPGAARPRLARGQGRCATRATAWGRAGAAVYLDCATPASALGAGVLRERYGNLFEHVPARHRRRSAARRRCASRRPPTTRWAGCGSTTTS